MTISDVPIATPPIAIAIAITIAVVVYVYIAVFASFVLVQSRYRESFGESGETFLQTRRRRALCPGARRGGPRGPRTIQPLTTMSPPERDTVRTTTEASAAAAAAASAAAAAAAAARLRVMAKVVRAVV